MNLTVTLPRKTIGMAIGLRRTTEPVQIPATDHSYAFTVGFGASDTYIRFTALEYYGAWTEGAMTNVAGYYVKVNGVAQTLPAEIACGDDVEIRIVKTEAGTASITINGTYELTAEFEAEAAGADLHYVDDWMLDMLESYQTLHYNQLDDEMARQLLIRLQPDYVDYLPDGLVNDTGYYYHTFGPEGAAYEECTFVVMLRAQPAALMNCYTGSSTVRLIASRVNVNGRVTNIISQNLEHKYYDGNPLYITLTNDAAIYNNLNKIWGIAIDGRLPYMPSYSTLYLPDVNGHIPSIDCAINFMQYAWAAYKGIEGKLPLMTCSGSSVNYVRFNYNNLSELHAGDTFDWINVNTTSISLDYNNFPTAVIDDILARINARVQQFVPAQNITILLNGPSNGIPTGGNNNADRLAIIARYAAAGKSATVTVRTS